MSEQLREVFFKESAGHPVNQSAPFIDTDWHHLRPILPGADEQQGDIVRSDWRGCIVLVGRGLPNALQNSQDDVLTMCLKEECILLLSERRFDEYVPQLCLQCRV